MKLNEQTISYIIDDFVNKGVIVKHENFYELQEIFKAPIYNELYLMFIPFFKVISEKYKDKINLSDMKQPDVTQIILLIFRICYNKYLNGNPLIRNLKLVNGSFL